MKTILKPLRVITNFYNKLTIWGKIIIIVMILLLFVVIFNEYKNKMKNKEGFQQANGFVFKDGPELYDDFYANIYDHLVFNNVKNEYEIGQIINSTKPTEESIILDIGCGTGNHVSSLNRDGYKTIGMDNSEAMVKKAKEIYPDLDFVQGDALNAMEFQPSSFTHILCMYFTIYYFKDKELFFNNAMKWLMPGGHLVVHIVDRDMFDPILPPANPLLMLTPQRYAKERITSSSIVFQEFKYYANFEYNKKENRADFVEKFKNKDTGKIFRKQEHHFYMEPESKILEIARDAGFIVAGKVDLIKAGYEYQYLYVFQKPE
jgi:SAM-dependent methyltransferase